jgi:hypothetical protein
LGVLPAELLCVVDGGRDENDIYDFTFCHKGRYHFRSCSLSMKRKLEFGGYSYFLFLGVLFYYFIYFATRSLLNSPTEILWWRDALDPIQDWLRN